MAPQNKQMPLEDVIIISGHYWPLNTPTPFSYAASLDQINMQLFYWVVFGVCTWLFSAMPFAVEQMFRDASEVKRGTSKQFVYEKQSVDARIALGERVMRCLRALHGKKRTGDILEVFAKRANGFQPRLGDDDSDPTIKQEYIP